MSVHETSHLRVRAVNRKDDDVRGAIVHAHRFCRQEAVCAVVLLSGENANDSFLVEGDGRVLTVIPCAVHRRDDAVRRLENVVVCLVSRVGVAVRSGAEHDGNRDIVLTRDRTVRRRNAERRLVVGVEAERRVAEGVVDERRTSRPLACIYRGGHGAVFRSP